MKSGGNTTTKLYAYETKKEIFIIKVDKANIINFIFVSYIQGIQYKPVIQMLKEKGLNLQMIMMYGVNQHFVTNDNPRIISREQFDLVKKN